MIREDLSVGRKKRVAKGIVYGKPKNRKQFDLSRVICQSFFIGYSDDGGSNYDAEVVPLTSHNDIIETDATECPDIADIGSYSCPFGCPVEFSLEATRAV